MKNKVIILLLFIAFGCTKNAENFVPFIEGYWQIGQVKKEHTIIKEYTISTSIDYFQINEDGTTGFRKKVMPKLDGTFTITEHEIPFTLEYKDNTIQIIYSNTSDTLRETILNASKKSLTITNTDGFIYIYKNIEKLTFD